MNQNDLILKKPQTEYLENPLGIDLPQPRLGWGIVSARRGVRQGAYFH